MLSEMESLNRSSKSTYHSQYACTIRCDTVDNPQVTPPVRN